MVCFHGAVSNASESTLLERLNTKLFQLVVALIVTWVVIASFRPVMDNVDLGWHIAQGRWMVEHAAIYWQDAFNYPNLGHAVIDEYPLFQVVLYAAWSLGWWGTCLLTALAYAGLVLVLSSGARRLDHPTLACLAVALSSQLVYLQAGPLLRPHLATYLGIAILGTFLLRHREAATWTAFWPMALLQIAWTNSHSGFVIGPAMVGLFGTEMVVRHVIKDRAIPWITLRTWLGATLLVLLACFINPYGAARFHPAIFQDQLESIRAYVGEMEPLTGTQDHIFKTVTLVVSILIASVALRGRGALPFSFLLLAIFFFYEAQSARKAWPVVGLFGPLLTMGSMTFRPGGPDKTAPMLQCLMFNVMMACMVAIGLETLLDSNYPSSVHVQWQELARGRSELSHEATAWMKAHGVKGRLFTRCEDGGWLQQEGFDHGEVFSDTGFGKYDETFIHEVGLVNERPALVPRYLQAYQPQYVVCGTFCYQWPYYLKQNGWRLIFYSPNSSVWTQPGTRPDLPTVSDEEVKAAFDRDLAAYGRPVDIRLFGRNLIALNSLGLEDFVMAELKALPPELHHASWYWEAARFMCFTEPAFSPAHREELLREAEQLHDDAVTAEFRAYAANAAGDVDGALRILEKIPPRQLGNYGAELLLKIYLNRKQPEALALAQRTDCFDLRNGRHWQYLAEAEEQAGHPEAAATAWQRAVFYYPDDAALMAGASAYATTYRDPVLAQAIAKSGKAYGQQ